MSSDLPFTKFPVEPLLKLYIRLSKSTRTNRLYLNYYAELKLLIEWLGPFTFTEPKHVEKITWYNTNYEVQELARHLRIDQAIVLALIKELDND